jgi:hypothetical protein
METTDTVRERLLSRLPQPDQLTAYRQEVAELLAKHKRALFWDGMGSKVGGLVAVVCYFLGLWAKNNGLPVAEGLFTLAGLGVLGFVVGEARLRISHIQVGLLKEIKQLQLQVLELQASLHRTDDE